MRGGCERTSAWGQEEKLVCQVNSSLPHELTDGLLVKKRVIAIVRQRKRMRQFVSRTIGYSVRF